jgi:hypothetical protein
MRLGPSVLEIVESDDGNACRPVYTVRFEKAVYVLRRVIVWYGSFGFFAIRSANSASSISRLW